MILLTKNTSLLQYFSFLDAIRICFRPPCSFPWCQSRPHDAPWCYSVFPFFSPNALHIRTLSSTRLPLPSSSRSGVCMKWSHSINSLFITVWQSQALFKYCWAHLQSPQPQSILSNTWNLTINDTVIGLSQHSWDLGSISPIHNGHKSGQDPVPLAKSEDACIPRETSRLDQFIYMIDENTSDDIPGSYECSRYDTRCAKHARSMFYAKPSPRSTSCLEGLAI